MPTNMARAKAAQSPANAKARRADQQRGVNVLASRQHEAAPEQGLRPRFREPIRGDIDQQATAHHEGERRVPPARKVEKALHAGGVGHPGNGEAKAKDEAAKQGDELAHAATTCRSTKTVRKPKAMKVTVATSERVEKRASPQIPWPEVQPLPSRVP